MTSYCKYPKKIFILLPIVLLSACKASDWLDEKNDISQVVPTTLKDCQAIMDQSEYINQGYTRSHEIASDNYYAKEGAFVSLTDEINAYTWSRIVPFESSLEWYNAYRRVFYCNLVLETLNRIETSSSNDKQTKDDLQAQALFIRAYTFYDLSIQYAHPYSSSSINDLGIPMRLESDINLPTIRSSVRQNYDQIIADLQKAKDLVLPVVPIYKTRASKIAIFATLARIYLSMEHYSEAKVMTDSCLNIYNRLLNYNDGYIPSPNSPASATYPFTDKFNGEVLFYSSMLFSNLIAGGSDGYIDSVLYKSYNTNDLRKTLFYQGPTPPIKFTGSYSGGMLVCMTGPCTDEMYLIRAECLARSGNTIAAMDDLNTLLMTRWKKNTFLKYTATDSKDALQQIIAERNKELIFRGIRWTDLRRLNNDSNFILTLTRTYNNSSYSLKPNSDQYTFPLPEDIISATGMQQNEGWY
ncbi:MAG: RagB/SusD family nutrient uptake outer membrane protein [Chitinophagaceae bacterium]